MITVNTDEVKKLERGLSQYQSILPKSVAASALKKATRPMVKMAKAEAPVGKSKNVLGGNSRGGATRRDTRVKVVPVESGEIARLIIGVSKKRDKVGWRTHFITRGFTDRGGKRHAANDFLKRAYEATIGAARAEYATEILIAFKKWAQKNLPQGRF